MWNEREEKDLKISELAPTSSVVLFQKLQNGTCISFLKSWLRDNHFHETNLGSRQNHVYFKKKDADET